MSDTFTLFPSPLHRGRPFLRRFLWMTISSFCFRPLFIGAVLSSKAYEDEEPVFESFPSPLHRGRPFLRRKVQCRY